MIEGIVEATTRYETWLADRVPLIKHDLDLKHRAMSAGSFPFLRATFYRWAARWAAVVGDVARAPAVLSVGDLHVENFGTWRDAEGRLIWGVNDFDEAWPLPYTNDLVRLGASALLARSHHDLRIDGEHAISAILDGYRQALEAGGHAFVLAEQHTALREMAVHRLHHPEAFWGKLRIVTDAQDPCAAACLEGAPPGAPRARPRDHRASSRGPREPWPPAVYRVGHVAWRSGGAGGQGAGPIRVCASRSRHADPGRADAPSRDGGPERRGREDPLRSDPGAT